MRFRSGTRVILGIFGILTVGVAVQLGVGDSEAESRESVIRDRPDSLRDTRRSLHSSPALASPNAPEVGVLNRGPMNMGLDWGDDGGTTGDDPAYPSTQLEVGRWKPNRVASLSDGSLAVAFTNAGRVAVFSPEGNLLFELKKPVVRPTSVTYHEQRQLLLIGDEHTNRVNGYHFSGPGDPRNGEWLLELGQGTVEFDKPIDLSVDPFSGWIYVADSPPLDQTIDPERGLIRVFSIEVSLDGTSLDAPEIGQWGTRGEADGQLLFPSGIAVSAERGEVFVSDMMAERVLVYDLNGQWLRTIGDSLTRPQGIAVAQDSAGDVNIFVADAYQSEIQAFDAVGTSLETIGKFGDEPGQLKTPIDVCIDSYGRLIVASWASGKLERFEITGAASPPDDLTVPAIVDLKPSEVSTSTTATFGGWLYVRFTLHPVEPSTVDFGSLLLNGTVPPDPTYGAHVGDSDKDGIPELQVRFPLLPLLEPYLTVETEEEDSEAQGPQTFVETIFIEGSFIAGDSRNLQGTSSLLIHNPGSVKTKKKKNK